MHLYFSCPRFGVLLVFAVMHVPYLVIRWQDHSHSHGHNEVGDGTTTAAKRFGIDNFVYRQRRPFHPERLGIVLKVLFFIFGLFRVEIFVLLLLLFTCVYCP